MANYTLLFCLDFLQYDALEDDASHAHAKYPLPLDSARPPPATRRNRRLASRLAHQPPPSNGCSGNSPRAIVCKPWPPSSAKSASNPTLLCSLGARRRAACRRREQETARAENDLDIQAEIDRLISVGLSTIIPSRHAASASMVPVDLAVTGLGRKVSHAYDTPGVSISSLENLLGKHSEAGAQGAG